MALIPKTPEKRDEIKWDNKFGYYYKIEDFHGFGKLKKKKELFVTQLNKKHPSINCTEVKFPRHCDAVLEARKMEGKRPCGGGGHGK